MGGLGHLSRALGCLILLWQGYDLINLCGTDSVQSLYALWTHLILFPLLTAHWDLDRTVWVWRATSASLVWIEKQNLTASAWHQAGINHAGQHLKSDCPGKHLTVILRGHILILLILILLLSVALRCISLDFFVAEEPQADSSEESNLRKKVTKKSYSIPSI